MSKLFIILASVAFYWAWLALAWLRGRTNAIKATSLRLGAKDYSLPH